MRDLAQRLLTYEVNAGEVKTGNSFGPAEPPILRVYEKLRESLGEFAGTAAFQSLASRALAMARSGVPSLQTAQVSANGELNGLRLGLERSKYDPQINVDKNGTGQELASDEGGDEGIAIIARLLGLLLIFLGEPITLRLLRNAWPGASFDDFSSEYGRKA
jgi:hypothetical protein